MQISMKSASGLSQRSDLTAGDRAHKADSEIVRENGRNRKGSPSSDFDMSVTFFKRSETWGVDDRLYEELNR